MEKLKALYANSHRKIVTAAVTAVVACPMLANAADGDIDLTKTLLYFAGGTVAIGTLIGLGVALSSMIGVGKQAKSAAR